MGVSLSDLYEMNPQEITRAQRDQIVSSLREMRGKFLTERQAARTEGRKAKTSENAAPKKVRGFDLGDLDLSGLNDLIKK